jgi:hypothetical protein
VLEAWLGTVDSDDLPHGIFELRSALADDRDRGELD